MSVTLSGCRKPKRELRLTYQCIYAPQMARIDVKWVKFEMAKPR